MNDITLNSTDIALEFLRGRKQTTTVAYAQSLDDFSRFVGGGAIRSLLSHGYAHAARLAFQYRANLVERDLAAQTVNARLAAVRALCRFACDVGLIDWTLRVPNVKAIAYRDTRGPERERVAEIVQQLSGRDLAIVRLMHDVGLRRGEVVSLDMAHVSDNRISVKGKGFTDREWITLPMQTLEVLRRWINERGEHPGPLFTNYRGGRLTGGSIARMTRKKAGVNPHGFRHAGVTAACEAAGGDYREVQKFSRHANQQTVQLYDDKRKDIAGKLAAKVAEL